TDAGIFFGYRQDEQAGRRIAYQYQYVMLERHEFAQDPAQRYSVGRHRSRDRTDGQPAPGGEELARQYVPTPPFARPCHLTLVCHETLGLVEARWDGTPLPALTQRSVNAKLAPADYVGMFGTFQRTGSVTFGRLQFLLANERDAR